MKKMLAYLSVIFVFNFVTSNVQAQWVKDLDYSETPVSQEEYDQGICIDGREEWRNFFESNAEKMEEAGIPSEAWNKVANFYEQSLERIKNTRFIAIANFDQPSRQQRFYIINTKTGAIQKFLVSHGRGSDPKITGQVEVFSNSVGSLASAKGIYLTKKGYNLPMALGGPVMHIEGVESTNNMSFPRGIMVHGATWVSEKNRWAGLSHGCFAFDFSVLEKVIEELKDGAVLLAYGSQESKVLAPIKLPPKKTVPKKI